jgi:chaperonin cofactor prefoldin
MERPDELILSQIYKFIGDLYVQMNELKKAEKSLKDSENLLKNIKFENQ